MNRRVARALAIVAGLASALGVLNAVEGASKNPPPISVDAAGPSTQLKSAPRLTRVRFEVAPSAAVIVHELVFPKGALSVAGPASAGDASIFVAFTAQARPMAIEATKHALDDTGKLLEAGSALPIADVFVRPANAAIVLGSSKFAGHVVKIPRGDAPFGLRIRSAIATDVLPTATEVSLMARLGVRDGAPIAIDRIEVVGVMGTVIRGARAALCGPSADPSPLLVEFPGYPPSPLDAGAMPLASAKRKPDDDLCVLVQI